MILFRSKSTLSSRAFLVYGRNLGARRELTELLQQLGLAVLDWEGAVALTGKASPHAREVLEAALSNVGAVVVLLSGDEEARLRPEFCTPDDAETEGRLNAQSRPNVIFEAGLAFGLFPTRTVVVQLGRLRALSDIAGIQYVPLDESPESRRALANRLRTAGCAVVENASSNVGLPRAAEGLPAVAHGETGRLGVFRKLKSFLPLPGMGGSLEVAQSVRVGEKLMLSVDLPPEAREYRVMHWRPGAASGVQLLSGTRTSESIDLPVTIAGTAGIHFFDLEVRAGLDAFVVVARAQCTAVDA
jgi:Predicted nucleotide-binding protein containing TIR-like domain